MRMGICGCCNGNGRRKWNDEAASAKVVDVEGPGRVEEFWRRVTAEEVLSGHPNCYLCSSDSMYINTNAPQLPKDDVLQLGQIYFLMPLSKSLTPLSLQDLCLLAIKTSTALDKDKANASTPLFHQHCTTSYGNNAFNNNIATS